MEEILGYVLSKFLDVIVYDLRAILGNWGCLMVSILVAGILFWFVPAYLLDLPGHDWKTWLVVGPLATIAVVLMVAGTYGFTRGAGSQSDEPAAWSTLAEPFARDVEVLTKDIPETIQRHIDPGSKECPYCAATLNARAVMCRHCGRNTRRFAIESTLKSGGQGESRRKKTP
jgi:ribosomal protein L40E